MRRLTIKQECISKVCGKNSVNVFKNQTRFGFRILKNHEIRIMLSYKPHNYRYNIYLSLFGNQFKINLMQKRIAVMVIYYLP